jgi:hypothetical protein
MHGGRITCTSPSSPPVTTKAASCVAATQDTPLKWAFHCTSKSPVLLFHTYPLPDAAPAKTKQLEASEHMQWMGSGAAHRVVGCFFAQL